MSKKFNATFLGICASFCGIVIWVLLSFIGFIAGIAGALMGIAFILVYNRINQEDESNYPYVMAGIVIIVDIIIAELITIAILAAPYGVSLAEAMQEPEISNAVILDVGVGLLLSFLCYFGYISSQKRRKKAAQRMAEYNESYIQADESQQYGYYNREAVSRMREITIVREKKFAASLVKISYVCDGAVVATAKNGQTVTFSVDGRRHSLCAVMPGAQGQTVLIEADGQNKTYYLKIKAGMGGTDLLLEKY